MTNIIEQYYRGITLQLRSEVNFINSLFHHQGVKGEGNETLLRELITKFIPKKYGVGTGIIIDRYGRQSKQCDIVIYDTFLYPSLLSLSTVHLFPVDIVYATIEVKTKIDYDKAKDSIANIESIKNLQFIPGEFMVPESDKGGISFVTYKSTSPIGVVFSYSSETQSFETFKNWFTPKNGNEVAKFPVLVGCLDQGLIYFNEIYPHAEMKPQNRLMPLIQRGEHDQLEPTRLNPREEYYTYDGMVYPVTSFQGNHVVVDQSRTLLLFILFLDAMLSKRKINPEINFIDNYISEDTFYHLSL